METASGGTAAPTIAAVLRTVLPLHVLLVSVLGVPESYSQGYSGTTGTGPVLQQNKDGVQSKGCNPLQMAHSIKRFQLSMCGANQAPLVPMRFRWSTPVCPGQTPHFLSHQRLN
jgi:hypothetical protein